MSHYLFSFTWRRNAQPATCRIAVDEFSLAGARAHALMLFDQTLASTENTSTLTITLEQISPA